MRKPKQDSASKALTYGKSKDDDLQDIFRLMDNVRDKRDRLKQIGQKYKTKSISHNNDDLGSSSYDEGSTHASPLPEGVSSPSSPRIFSYSSAGVHRGIDRIFQDITCEVEEGEFVDEDLGDETPEQPWKTTKTGNFDAMNAEAPESKRRVCTKKLLAIFILVISIITGASVWVGHFSSSRFPLGKGLTASASNGSNMTRPKNWKPSCFKSYQELNKTVLIYLKNPSSHGWIGDKYGYPIGTWCVKRIASFHGLFSAQDHADKALYENFNEPLDGWDVSSATSLEGMFAGAKSFNQDLSMWNVGHVSNFRYMFKGAEAFNSDLSSWNVQKAIHMEGMFEGASSFVGFGLENWGFSVLESMDGMFHSATSFNGNVSAWHVSTVRSMDDLFRDADLFHRDLHQWRFGPNLVSMARMFMGTASFNGRVDGWNLQDTRVTSLERLFKDAESFNQPLNGWNTSKITNFERIFDGAIRFNQDLNGWDTGAGTNFEGTFLGAIAFNGNISTWSMESAESIRQMLQGCRIFNGSIGTWRFSVLKDMSYAFSYSNSFDQDLDWDTATVTSMTGTFQNAVRFNGDIGGWNTSQVESMDLMFMGATSFNQDIGSWDLGQVREMGAVLVGASSFNQDLCDWGHTMKLRTRTGATIPNDVALSDLFSSSHGSIPMDFRLFLNSGCPDQTTPQYSHGSFIGPFCHVCSTP